MPVKPCLTCGRLSATIRCPAHTKTHEAARHQRKRLVRPYTSAERVRRAQAVAAWVAMHGHLCPGWRRTAHTSMDLTADHIIAVASGGTEQGELQVLCRACNAAKRDRPN